jgi:drug/metabolite transporter (DMT)-like permease
MFWAVGSVLIAVGAKRLHVVPLNLVRCLVSTTLFWTLLQFYGGFRALATIPSSAWLWLVVSVLGLLVVGDTLYFRSMDLAGVSWAMPVASINPLWSVLLAAVLVGEPLSWSLFAGSLLVVAGIILVSRSSRQTAGELSASFVEEGESKRDPRAQRTGLVLALAASVLWAIGMVALKPASAGIPTVLVNSVRQPMAALMMLGLTLARRQGRELRGLDRQSWGIILLASLLGTGIGTFFFIAAIQMIGAGRTAVLTSTAPMMAIPFSMLWLRERPTRWTLIGTVLTTAGIVLVV